MDLDEEWEVLPEDGFLEINDDGGKKIFSRKYNTNDDLLNMNYFPCPSQFVDSTKPSSKPTTTTQPSSHVVPPPITQVSFKKMNDNQTATDMKMDSPRSSNNKALFVPQSDVLGGEAYYKQGIEPFEGTKDVVVSSPRSVEGSIQENNEGFNFWQWSLSGIGAICSFGVAAATTICIVFIENHQKHKRQQNHTIRFQIYNDDKRIKEVVEHASKLGVPFTRAHITFGGYCDTF